MQQAGHFTALDKPLQKNRKTICCYNHLVQKTAMKPESHIFFGSVHEATLFRSMSHQHTWWIVPLFSDGGTCWELILSGVTMYSLTDECAESWLCTVMISGILFPYDTIPSARFFRAASTPSGTLKYLTPVWRVTRWLPPQNASLYSSFIFCTCIPCSCVNAQASTMLVGDEVARMQS